MSDVVLAQGEKKLLLDVEEAQNKLTALKNQLLLKTSQVADAKAELDHKSRSIQKITKCVSLQLVWIRGVNIEASLMSSEEHFSYSDLLMTTSKAALLPLPPSLIPSGIL